MKHPTRDKKAAATGEPEYLAQAEAITAATASFVRRFVVTIWYAAVLPKRLAAPGWAARIVPPYSFLSVSAILAGRAIRWATIAVLISVSTPFCASESWSPHALPPVKDYLTLPTLSELVLNSIPLVVVLSLFAELVSRHPGLRNHPASANVASQAFYATGFQAFIVLLIISVLGALSTDRPDLNVPVAIVSWLVVILVVMLPARTFAVVLMRPHDAGAPVLKVGALNVLKFLAAILFSTLTVGLFVAVTFPLSMKDLPSARPSRPILFFQVLSATPDAGGMTVSALIANTAYTRLLLRADSVLLTVPHDLAVTCYKGAWSTWNGSAMPAVALDSGQVGWATGRFALVPEPENLCQAMDYGKMRIEVVDLLSRGSSSHITALWQPLDPSATLAERMRSAVPIGQGWKWDPGSQVGVETEGLKWLVGIALAVIAVLILTWIKPVAPK